MKEDLELAECSQKRKVPRGASSPAKAETHRQSGPRGTLEVT